MSIFLFILGALLIATLARLRLRRTARLLGLSWVVIFWLLGNGVATRWITNGIQDGTAPPQITWQPGTVIVLLGMGLQRMPQEGELVPPTLAYSRILRTVQLHNACTAFTHDCKVVVSGGDPSGLGKTEAKLYASLLVQAGVPRTAIIEEGRSRNTWENARYTSRLLSQHPHAPVVLVTSGLHMRRALLYFRHFGLRPIAARSDDAVPLPSWWPNSYNLLLCDLVLLERLGIARYHLYNLLGWNEAPTPLAIAGPP